MPLQQVKLRDPNPDQMVLMMEWCQDHVQGSFWDTYIQCDKDVIYVTYAFQDTELAMQFALMWG